MKVLVPFARSSTRYFFHFSEIKEEKDLKEVTVEAFTPPSRPQSADLHLYIFVYA